MKYHVTSVTLEYPPTAVPAYYNWRTQQLLRSTGWTKAKLDNYCNRVSNPLPHVRERRGLIATRYFNPKEVAEWIKEEAKRRVADFQPNMVQS